MKAFLMAGSLLLALISHAQLPRTSELFLTMQALDSTFFEKGFNQCDLEFLEKAVHADLHFYHDLAGFQDKKLFLQKVRENICGTSGPKTTRKVAAETLTVYPLYQDEKLYGAIQSGTHKFYQRREGKDVAVGTAKFTHVYLLQNGNWVLKEVLSYDHGE